MARDWNPPSPEETASLPGLASGGIAIQPWSLSDVERLYEAVRASHREVARWLSWCSPNYTRTDTESFLAARAAAWESGSDFAFAIVDESDGRLLGGCGLNEFRRLHHVANLGYWVRTNETGRGVASTATRLVARFGFVHLGLGRAEIVAAVGNIASRRAAEKAGAHREGILRNRLYITGVYHDAAVYSLLPADFGL